MKISASSLITLIMICLPMASWSGAWVPSKGNGYAKLAYAYYNADDVFGSGLDDGEFTGINYSFYGEQGLGNNFAVFGTVLYQDLEQTTAGVATESSGFGDLELGLRYQWQAEPFVFSTSFLVKLPNLYDEADELPRGNGQEDYELKFQIGKSLNQYGYYGVEFGYRMRTAAPSDEYRYLLEYGINVNKNFYLRSKLDGIKSVENADTAADSANLILAPEFDLGKLELTAGWTFGQAKDTSWGVELTYNHDLYGDDTLRGNGFQVGIARKY